MIISPRRLRGTRSVTAGQVTGSIDAVLWPGGSISGTVTAAGGSPLQGICVEVCLLDGTGVGGTGTDPDGTYTVTGLAAGNYNVKFSSEGECSGGVPANYITQWYDNQPSQAAGNTASVTAGQYRARLTPCCSPCRLRCKSSGCPSKSK